MRDAYRYTGDQTAFDVEVKFASWVEKTLRPLNDEHIQKMLATEFGGMNEVLADLYADTGDVRWLKLAEKFHHNAIVDPLEKERDILPGVHGNTQVPKLYGELAFAQPGQMQTERDFNQQGEDSSPLQLEGHFGRHGTKWFSFDLPVETNHPMTLVVTYSNDNWRHTSCEVLVDGQKVGEKAGEHRSPEQQIRFTDVEYPIATDLLKDKKKVTVRFEAKMERPSREYSEYAWCAQMLNVRT